ncbi:MAG: MnmC family methyltransferase [Calothrix sp. MO_192.B10]|nr:MnmC family methyltransferase [Calothrix sp. MO_192.B10]
MINPGNFVPQITADGSFTFFSQEFGEHFHSHYGARQESFLKFAAPTQLSLKAKKQVVNLLDVCYGLGYNTAAALETIWSVNPNCHVELIGLEINASVAESAIKHHLFDTWNSEYQDILQQLAFTQQVQTNRLTAKLLIGDARNLIERVQNSGFLADAIFLDPFSPPQCPQLWTLEFIRQVALCLHSDGLLATYSCAAAVRTALIVAGLTIASTPPVGRRTPGTIAAWESKQNTNLCNLSNLFLPLSQPEQEHLLTRAAVPYRDPQLKDSPEIIINRRTQEQKASCLEPTSHWRKRWLIKN